jgi:hypothetical protein
MQALLILGAAAVVGYLVLFPPRTEAGAAVATAETEAGEPLEGLIPEWAGEDAAQEAAGLAVQSAVAHGDLVGAIVGVVALAFSQDAQDDNERQWVEGIIATWDQLPDTWFLERGKVEAFAGVIEYLPYPMDWPGFSIEHLAEGYQNGSAYMRKPLQKLRWAYDDRMDRVLAAALDAPATAAALALAAEQRAAVTPTANGEAA